jgi:malic enzyme
VVVGAGAAGVGIARLLRDTLRRSGLAADAVTRAVAVLDVHGLVMEGEGAAQEYRRAVAWPHALAAELGVGPGQPSDLLAVVRALRPHALIGVSGASGAFTEAAVREMARHVERPLVLPLSNPTSQAEARPADVLAWTDGRALVATGSPFDPVMVDGRAVRIGQGNNAFIFPGVGLGALLSEAREVTPAMFAAAAASLADQLRQEDVDAGSLYPPIAALRRVTARIAEAVMREARDGGTGLPLTDAEIPARVAGAMWEPKYLPLVPAR